MSHKKAWLLGLVFLALAIPSDARADSVSFSWSGGSTIDLCATLGGTLPNLFGIPVPASCPEPGSTSSGSGSFTFPDGLTSVSVGDLTSFSFTESNVELPETLFGFGCGSGVGIPIPCADTTYAFGIADVTSLSADLSGGSVTALTMMLARVNGTDPFFGPVCCEDFTVNSLAKGGVFTSDGLGTVRNTGDVTVTEVVSTPEPASFLLLGTGLFGLGATLRRKRESLRLTSSGRRRS